MLVDNIVQAMWQIHNEICFTHSSIPQETQQTSDVILVCLIVLILLVSFASLVVIYIRCCGSKKLSPFELTREGKLNVLDFQTKEAANYNLQDPLIE